MPVALFFFFCYCCKIRNTLVTSGCFLLLLLLHASCTLLSQNDKPWY